jgi:hypothetical protein
MASFNGKRVSWPHKVILDDLERRGILKFINSGQRTMAEQTKLWLEKGQYHPIKNPDGAAFPNPFAPHIKKGKLNHAIDINDGTSDRVAAAYRDLGVPAVFNVSTEPWHIDFPDEGDLVRAAGSIRRMGGHLATLKPGMNHNDVRVMRYWLTDTGDFSVKRWRRLRKRTKYGPELVKAAKRFQKRRGLVPDGIVGPATWLALEKSAKRDKGF